MAFINDHFLLETNTAQELYHQYASQLPIIDYHNHLIPSHISENYEFSSITEAWLAGDHYKWRAMRTLGVNEHYITGNASEQEKFHKWSYTVPYTMRNPLYHWTHLELKRYFSIETLLNEHTAETIYANCNERLQGIGARDLLEKQRVEIICTTDDPVDDLKPHQSFADKGHHLKLLPGFRPDKALLIANPGYKSYIEQLSLSSGISITDFDTLVGALSQRIQFFHHLGCRVSDHGINYVPVCKPDVDLADKILKKALKGEPIDQEAADKFLLSLLLELGRMYDAHSWVMQLHLGALRNNNTRMMRELGPDTGFDSIGDFPQAAGLANFLNLLDATNHLPKTILYNLNPGDNELIGTMIGNFNDGSVKGKVQFGAAWWFLDQKDGMEKHLNALSNMSLLSCFVGMLTDSRSFLSFPRHEYFRRILCNLIGWDVEKGFLPKDIDWLGSMLAGVCYHNAVDFFDF